MPPSKQLYPSAGHGALTTLWVASPIRSYTRSVYVPLAAVHRRQPRIGGGRFAIPGLYLNGKFNLGVNKPWSSVLYRFSLGLEAGHHSRGIFPSSIICGFMYSDDPDCGIGDQIILGYRYAYRVM
jgi:hypothetical protein